MSWVYTVSTKSPFETATIAASTVYSSFQVHNSEYESTQGNQNLGKLGLGGEWLTIILNNSTFSQVIFLSSSKLYPQILEEYMNVDILTPTIHQLYKAS